jgi:inosine/xanthosine triphosphatase
MIVALGSKNPAKKRAVEAALKKLGIDASVVVCSVPSGVSEQPRSDEETMRGALNRARAARELHNADYGVGLEGGVHETPEGLFLSSWAAIVTRDGQSSVGGSPRFLLPNVIAARIRNGEELGPIIDDVYARTNIAHNEGAFGLFTTYINRDDAFAQALLCAFAPLRSERYH